jgi:hypothetical protein
MNSTKKILLGLITLWPLLYLVAFMFFAPVLFFAAPDFPIEIVFFLHPFTMFVIVGLLVFYVRDALNNKKIPETRKTLWVVLLIIGNAIVMPIYFYSFIMKKRG